MNESTSVIFHFPDRDTRDRFLSGLVDGFGENFCLLEWPWGEGVSLKDATEVTIAEVYRTEDEGLIEAEE